MTSDTSRSGRKGGGKQIVDDKSEELYSWQFPGALPVKQVIYGLQKFSGFWRRATVIHCRAATDLPRLAEHYDYYVHWEQQDRRLDCWLSWVEIRQLNESLPDNATLAEDDQDSDDTHGGMDPEYLKEHEENTKLKTINKIAMGNHLVHTWYFSPYPEEYQNRDVLYICQFCLAFFRTETDLLRHNGWCRCRCPPGNEIYRDPVSQVSVWEVDGSHSRVYCENLCFLAKLFLDHKTLKHPVHLFLFYTLAEFDANGFRVVGYFSKEKYSRNNLSCICTFPQYQRKGYGRMLIEFSYVLSRRERKRGTPERPLSDLGRASYMTHWTATLIDLIREKSTISMDELADAAGFELADVIECLDANGILRWKGNGDVCVYLPEDTFDRLKTQTSSNACPVIPELLHWQPYDPFLAACEFNPHV